MTTTDNMSLLTADDVSWELASQFEDFGEGQFADLPDDIQATVEEPERYAFEIALEGAPFEAEGEAVEELWRWWVKGWRKAQADYRTEQELATNWISEVTPTAYRHYLGGKPECLFGFAYGFALKVGRGPGGTWRASVGEHATMQAASWDALKWEIVVEVMSWELSPLSSDKLRELVAWLDTREFDDEPVSTPDDD